MFLFVLTPCPVSGDHYTGDSATGYFVFVGKLSECLLALDVIRNYLRPIPAQTTVETASTVLAFISLDTASQAVVDHIR